MISVTALSRDSKNNFTVTFSTGETVKVPLDTALEYSLRMGLELSGDEFEGLIQAVTLSRAKARALRIIGAGAMSRKQLYNKLVNKGETPQNAETCVEWLTGMGLLNDEQYAESIVRHYAGKGYGAGKVRNELYRRGVPRQMWDDALSKMPEQDDKIDLLLRRKLGGERTDRKELKKATDSLARRGFSWEEIKGAISRLDYDGDD